MMAWGHNLWGQSSTLTPEVMTPEVKLNQSTNRALWQLFSEPFSWQQI
jgi:hypothetical protein